ncbi:Na+/H+ antiporter NhaA [Tessaracoccus terricola]
MSQPTRKSFRILPHELWRGIHATARSDVFGGVLLLAAAVGALVLANSPAADWYTAVRDFRVGPAGLHLDLSIGTWAADGLLAIFFFVVGLELKEEFVDGKLRDPRKAALPIAAAVGGVVVPALIFLAVNSASGPEALRGWAIPTATDIAFAVAVLAVVGRFLPPALRVFLLTLAIVDDLIAITIIAVAYTESISLQWLLLALVPLLLFALVVQRGVRAWWLLVPLAVLTWALVHASGVHATVAGVLLGFTVPVMATPRARVSVGEDRDGTPLFEGLAAHFADRWGLVATVFAVPVFAFFSAGVPLGGVDGLVSAMSDPVTLGIMAGLVLGKPIGILGVTFVLTRFRSLGLDPSLRWPDLVGMSFVAGIGFTVSLLVGELAFEGTEVALEHVKVGVLGGSLVAAVIGGVLLGVRNKAAR